MSERAREQREPTAKQLATAADICRRFASARKGLFPSEVDALFRSADVLGTASLAKSQDAAVRYE